MELYVLFTVLILVSLLLTVGWVMLLVDAARHERWGWFVVMLIFSITAIPYLFLEYGKGARPDRARG